MWTTALYVTFTWECLPTKICSEVLDDMCIHEMITTSFYTVEVTDVFNTFILKDITLQSVNAITNKVEQSL